MDARGPMDGGDSLNYESTITRESISWPGARYTFRRISEGMRADLRRKLADAFGRLREVGAQRDGLHAALAERLAKPLEAITVGELTAGERRELEAIEERQALIQETEIQPAYFAAAFVRVEGLTVDGTAPDGPLLREAGPPALVREITDAIVAESALTPAERENFGSPTTSGAPVDGPTNDTIAQPASGTDSTNAGSATNTSPAQA